MSDKREQHHIWRADSGYAGSVTLKDLLPIYTALDHAGKETRLLAVEPGLPDDDIRCRLTPLSLLRTPLPSYETISYVWGDSSVRGSVLVNEQTLDVPTSTEHVLRRMRDAQQVRVLWIDSICIDQGDKDDRNYQVALMCDIYSRATQCLVWIGEEDGESIGQTFQELRDLYKEAQVRTDNFRTFKETVWPGWWSVYGEASSVKVDTEAMARLFHRPWFSRLWVVQEVALSQRSVCHCGSYTLPMDCLLKSAIWLWNKSKTSPSRLTGHLGLARAVHVASYSDALFAKEFRLETKLQWMLHTLRQYDSSRDVDHVYGILGMYQKFLLGSRALPTRLLPDYNRPVKEVMSDVAKLIIEESGQLSMLMYVSHRSSHEVDGIEMPSWVPKYHRKQDIMVDHLPFNFSGFAASGESVWRMESCGDTPLYQLKACGFRLGSVVEVTEVFDLETILDHDKLYALLSAAREMNDRRGAKTTGLERTLVAGHNHQRTAIGARRSIDGFAAMWAHLQTTTTVPSLHALQDDPALCLGGAYHEALTRWTRNRRLFRTDTGHLGLGPRMVRHGDIMAILYGCSVPVALRPRTQSEYALVGDVYSDGIMSGEAVQEHNATSGMDEMYLIS